MTTNKHVDTVLSRYMMQKGYEKTSITKSQKDANIL